MGDMPEPMGGRNRGKKHAQEFAEGHANRGDRAGLDNEEECPAVEKSPHRPE